MFHILKEAVSELLGDCIPLIADIADLTIAGFECRPCPAGLDVVKLVCYIISLFNFWSARIINQKEWIQNIDLHKI